MTAVRIGRLATYRRARIHLAIDGRTGCGAKQHAHIAHECNRPDLAVPGNLCRRCFTRTRVEVAEMALLSTTGVKAERNRAALAAVVQSMKSPAELAADADLVSRIAATMRAAGSIMTLAPAERVDAWEAARDSYEATHLTVAA
jgi:hypothetical protein